MHVVVHAQPSSQAQHVVFVLFFTDLSLKKILAQFVMSFYLQGFRAWPTTQIPLVILKSIVL